MRRAMVLAMTLAAAVAAAEWRAFLEGEPERQKRDDRVFETLDRLFQAEAGATPEDRPLIGLYATLTLSRARWQFRRDDAPPEPPVWEPGTKSQAWTRGQALLLLRERTAALTNAFGRLALTPATPFLGISRAAAPCGAGSALAVAWADLFAEDGDLADAAAGKALAVARAAGDDATEACIRLSAIRREDDADAQGRAWRDFLAERTWPADIRAQVWLALADTETNAVERVRLLADAHALATRHDLKEEALRALDAMRRAEVTLSGFPRLVLPGEPFAVTASFRNAARLWARTDGGVWRECALPKAEPYVWHVADVRMPALTPGEHRIDFRVDRSAPELRDAVESVTVTAAPFVAARVSADPILVYVADLATGRPLAGATVRHRGREAVTGATGLADLGPAPERGGGHGEETPRVTVSWRGQTLSVPDNVTKPWRARGDTRWETLSDRALYRPGDTVRVEVIALAARGERFVPDAAREGQAATLVLRGQTADGQRELGAQAVTFSPTGACDAAFALPETFSGSLSLALREEGDNAREQSVSVGFAEVAAFKAPSFTVSLRQADGGVPTRVAGEARDLTGLPLAGARVAWTARPNDGSGPAEGETTVAADGSFAVEVPIAHPDRPFFATVSAAVVAANGERQEARLWVDRPAHGFDFDLFPDPWAVEGEPFDVAIGSRWGSAGTLIAHPAGDMAATNILARADFRLAPDAKDGAPGVSLPLTLPAGAMTLEAVSGAVTNRTELLVLPKNGDLAVFGANGPNALVTTRTRDTGALAVGETLEGFAAIAGKGAAFLSVVTRAGPARIVPLDGPFFTLPVTADLAPAFALVVYGFDGATLRRDSRMLRVEPPEALTLTATRFAEVARPGSAQTWEIAVDDPDAELVVACADAALDALRAPAWPIGGAWCASWWHSPFDDLRDYFPPAYLTVSEPLPSDFRTPWGPTLFAPEPAAANTVTLGPVPIILRRAAKSEAAAAEDAAEAGGAAADAGPPPLRRDFAKTALWAPQKRLEDGKAVFSFTLPDTLTTWRLRAFAFTPDGRIGTLTRDCVARLDVMLRPYLPRVLRVGDSLTLDVALTNATDTPRDTWVSLNRGTRRPVRLPPGGTVSVPFAVRAQPVPGTQVFAFETEGDAVRLEIPVLDDRVPIDDFYPFTLVDTRPVTLRVSEPAAGTTLTLRLSPAPAKAVADALAATLEARCGSCDTVFEKLAAAALLRKLGIPRPVADEREDRWLDTLLAAREGRAWPWFPGGRADTCVTAEICVGAARLHTLGLLPEDLREAVLDTLGSDAPMGFAAWAYARAAFADVAPVREDLSDRLFRAYRAAGSVQERRLIAIAAARLGVRHVAEQGLRDLLDAAIRPKAGAPTNDWGLWWPQERVWWRWWDTPIESHALGVELLLAAGRGEDARDAARWLLQHRRLNDWGSARATAWAAFAILAAAPQDADAGETPRILREDTPFAGGRAVTLARQTPGTTFGALHAHCTLPLGQVPPSPMPEDAALTLTRTVSPADAKVGDTLEVTLTVTAAQPFTHIHLRDERPADTEPAEQLPHWDVSSGAWVVSDDVGTDFFLDRLPRGVTVFRYRLKRTHAGVCAPGLATLRPTHAPDFAVRTR